MKRHAMSACTQTVLIKSLPTVNIIIKCAGPITVLFDGEGFCAAGPGFVMISFRTPHFKGCTLIAHNTKGYGHHLFLNTLIEESTSPSITGQGSNIICFTDEDCRRRCH